MHSAAGRLYLGTDPACIEYIFNDDLRDDNVIDTVSQTSDNSHLEQNADLSPI